MWPRAMSNFTIGASLQTGQKQTPSNANASPSSLPSSVSSSVPSSAASSSTLFTSSSSVTVLTHSSTSPTPAAITSSITTLPTSSSSPSESPTILTSTVDSNVSNWTSSTPYNFPMENATLKVDKGFPAGGIAGIVVGGFVFLVIVIIVVVCLCRKFRRSEKYSNCFKSTANNRKTYEVNERSPKVSPKMVRSADDFSDSFTSRRGTLRTDEVHVVIGLQVNDKEAERFSESRIDHSGDDPPPVPRREVTSGRDSDTSRLSPQKYSTAFDPESENRRDTMDCFPDELPPPPPRDSVFIMEPPDQQ